MNVPCFILFDRISEILMKPSIKKTMPLIGKMSLKKPRFYQTKHRRCYTMLFMFDRKLKIFFFDNLSKLVVLFILCKKKKLSKFYQYHGPTIRAKFYQTFFKCYVHGKNSQKKNPSEILSNRFWSISIINPLIVLFLCIWTPCTQHGKP